jgi:hypothetical protein
MIIKILLTVLGLMALYVLYIFINPISLISRSEQKEIQDAWSEFYKAGDKFKLRMAKQYGAESKNFKSLYPDNTDEFVKELKENLIKEFGKDSDEYLEYFPKKKEKLPLQHSAKKAGFKE